MIGSRGISIIDIGVYIPQGTSLIVSGGARGVDCDAEKYAKAHNIPIVIFKPDYKQYGKSAPLKRNNQIVDFSDIVVAIWLDINHIYFGKAFVYYARNFLLQKIVSLDIAFL